MTLKRPRPPKAPPVPKAPRAPKGPKAPKRSRAAKKSTAPALRDLPPIPATVATVTGPIRVEVVEGLWENERCVGHFEWGRRIIRLESTLSLHSAWATLRHEIAHAWFFDQGLEMPEELTERLCDLIGAAMVYEMTH